MHCIRILTGKYIKKLSWISLLVGLQIPPFLFLLTDAGENKYGNTIRARKPSSERISISKELNRHCKILPPNGTSDFIFLSPASFRIAVQTFGKVLYIMSLCSGNFLLKSVSI